MLYVDVKVNNWPIQAFIDSGAQATIISKDCATACGIMHLLDKRFAGTAVGVGSARVLGRIHLADLEVGGALLQCSFTVLENNKVDLLFGLDNLKRHQCSIDLVNSMLHIKNGQLSVPFLSEGQINRQTLENETWMPSVNKPGASTTDPVKALTNMGFAEAKVIEALSASNGDKEKALDLLAEDGNAANKEYDNKRKRDQDELQPPVREKQLR